MRNRQWYDDHRWRLKNGYAETDDYLIEELKETQVSHRFISLMTNRMVFGTFRYGKWQHKKVKYDRIGSIKKRLTLFEKTGNIELLVDIANLAMIEFEVTDHPKAHFKSIDDGEHVEIIN